MVRKTAVLLLVLGLSGCMSMDSGPEPAGCPGSYGRGAPTTNVPGIQGAWGQPVQMIPPYTSKPIMNDRQAMAMMNNSQPLSMVQMGGGGPGGLVQTAHAAAPPGAAPPSIMIPKGGLLAPPGLPFAPGIPPSGQVVPANMPGGSPSSGGVIQAQAMAPPQVMAPYHPQMYQGNAPFTGQRTQVRFVRPSGMKVAWYTQGPDGRPAFSSSPIDVPGRYNFVPGAIYRLKLSNIEGRPGLEVYPTLEVVPPNHKTAAFLAHSAVPLDFTDEDFKQIAQGNYVVKVIYLPDPQFQELAGTGTEEILSTRLEPGADPIQEALRRGSILLVIRLGNVDQEAPNTPPIQAPSQQQAPALGAYPPGSAVMPHGMGQPPFPYGNMPPPPGLMTPGGVPLPPNRFAAPTMPPNVPGLAPRMPGFGPGATVIGPNGLSTPPNPAVGTPPNVPTGPIPGPSTPSFNPNPTPPVLGPNPPPANRGSIFNPKAGETPQGNPPTPTPETPAGPSLTPPSGTSKAGSSGSTGILPASVRPASKPASSKTDVNPPSEIPPAFRQQVKDAPANQLPPRPTPATLSDPPPPSPPSTDASDPPPPPPPAPAGRSSADVGSPPPLPPRSSDRK